MLIGNKTALLLNRRDNWSTFVYTVYNAQYVQVSIRMRKNCQVYNHGKFVIMASAHEFSVNQK